MHEHAVSRSDVRQPDRFFRILYVRQWEILYFPNQQVKANRKQTGGKANRKRTGVRANRKQTGVKPNRKQTAANWSKLDCRTCSNEKSAVCFTLFFSAQLRNKLDKSSTKERILKSETRRQFRNKLMATVSHRKRDGNRLS